MDITHIIHLILISTILVRTTMVLDMGITTHIIEIIITIIIITTIIITTEILLIPITQGELVAPITNQAVQQEHLNHKIHLPLGITIAVVEILGITVEILIEVAQVEVVDQEAPQVVDLLVAAGLQVEIATEDLLEILAVHEEDK
jgi:hypothetical protein